jgi:hypothetical protein
MDLEKIQQEVEALKNIDTTSITTPDQFIKLVEQLSTLLDKSEQSLLDTILINIENPTDNNE